MEITMDFAFKSNRVSSGVRLNCILVLLVSLLVLQNADADILVYQQDQLLEEFRDMPAAFGGVITESGIKVRAVRSNPVDGCSDIVIPPENATSTRFAVIIARYNCSFEDKVRNAQKAGYTVAIIHNVGSNDLEHMNAGHPEDILIPSIFIGESNGLYIIDSFLYPLQYTLIITDDVPFNINNNLIIPFAVVVGLCFIIMICFMIIRCIRERRRMLRHRLPKSVLKKIPIVKFTKGMQYDTCAICLDDYVDNERLRVLPCFHAYHVKCIDPWLTKNRRVCPICKRKVFVRGERRPPCRRSSTDSMSSSDPDEHTPLLNPVQNNSNSTTSYSTTGTPSQPNESVTASSRSSRPAHSARRQNDAHVVNMASDDDELLDDRNVHAVLNVTTRTMLATPQRRFNPFDRMVQSQVSAAHQANASAREGGSESPYSPIGEEQPTASAWKRFIWTVRNFRSGTQSRPLEENEDDDDDVEPVTTNHPVGGSSSRLGINTSAAVASNNILNSNLSGSFHGEDTTDDEMLGASYRDDTKRRQIRSAPNLPSTSGGAGSSGSSGTGRLGVAALPNVNFNPSQPHGGRNQGRRSNRGGSNSNNPV